MQFIELMDEIACTQIPTAGHASRTVHIVCSVADAGHTHPTQLASRAQPTVSIAHLRRLPQILRCTDMETTFVVCV